MKGILVATAYIISVFMFNQSPSSLERTCKVLNSFRFRISLSGSQNSLTNDTSTGIQVFSSTLGARLFFYLVLVNHKLSLFPANHKRFIKSDTEVLVRYFGYVLDINPNIDHFFLLIGKVKFGAIFGDAYGVLRIVFVC